MNIGWQEVVEEGEGEKETEEGEMEEGDAG